jgi:hypothetical protein
MSLKSLYVSWGTMSISDNHGMKPRLCRNLWPCNIFVFFCFLFTVLEFELRASCLLGRCCSTWAIPQPPPPLLYFLSWSVWITNREHRCFLDGRETRCMQVSGPSRIVCSSLDSSMCNWDRPGQRSPDLAHPVPHQRGSQDMQTIKRDNWLLIWNKKDVQPTLLSVCLAHNQELL